VVIATLGRPNELIETLESILSQSHLPLEVIIIDDSPDDSVKIAIEGIGKAFSSQSVSIRYIRNPRRKGLPIARNEGAKEAKGEIVLFLDDDVQLDYDYIEGILEVFETNPQAKGAQGFHGKHLGPRLKDRLANSLDRVFMIWSYDDHTCRVMPSFNATYPTDPEGIIESQWMSGCNQAYRREVFKELSFDEKIRRYGCEDLDMSYRVWKRYPHKVFLTSRATLVHRYSPVSRAPKRNQVVLQTVHLHYLFYKNMDQTVKNRALFCWSWFGRIVSSLLRRTKAQVKEGVAEAAFAEVGFIMEGLALSRRHKEELKRGDLAFLEKYLTF
jgi:GT2 family glycosyltransferase